MYGRELDGQTLSFGCSGYLWRDAVVMYDRETDSFFPQFTGQCIDGALKGKQLKVLPCAKVITWKECCRLFPNAQVLSIAGYQNVGADTYKDYDRSPQAGWHNLPVKDKRLRPKDRVVGLILDGKMMAYPLALLTEQPLFQHEFNGHPLVIFRDAVSRAVEVYERRVEGQTLTFEGSATGTRARDRGGNTWDMLTGKALSGPLTGEKLTPLPHVDAYWYAWSLYHPKTEVFQWQKKSSS